MALINCPECNNQISNKAKICPHCGYELPKQEIKFYGEYCPCCLETSLRSNKNEQHTKCPFCHIEMRDSIYGTHDEVCNFGTRAGLKQSIEFDEEAYQRRINYVPYEYSSSSRPKCPTCQSMNISKISNLESGASIAMWGIFSNKINKTFKCGSCGYTW